MSAFSLAMGVLLALSLSTNAVTAACLWELHQAFRSDLGAALTSMFSQVKQLHGRAVVFAKDGTATVLGRTSGCPGCGDGAAHPGPLAADLLIMRQRDRVAIVLRHDSLELGHEFSAEEAAEWAERVFESAGKAREAG